jgi:hypothetical protein
MEIGRYNKLIVNRQTINGFYLVDENLESVLLPNAYIPIGLNIDDEIEVFIYNDSENRIIATTLKPFVVADQIATLEVKEVTNFGAFLDWGLAKDLLLPYREMAQDVVTGQKVLVYVYLDNISNQLVATTKLNKYISTDLKPDLNIGQEVELKIWDFTSLGTKVIVNGMYSGLLYAQEIFQPLIVGQSVKGFVRKVREDNKIDVALQPTGIDNASNKAFDLIEYLEKNGHFLSLTDSSSPEEISKTLGISKKTFKKAIGMLYRSRQINIEENGIRLIEKK